MTTNVIMGYLKDRLIPDSIGAIAMEVSLETIAVSVTLTTIVCFFLGLAIWGVMDVIAHRKSQPISKHENITVQTVKYQLLEILTDVKSGARYTIFNDGEAVADLMPCNAKSTSTKNTGKG